MLKEIIVEIKKTCKELKHGTPRPTALQRINACMVSALFVVYEHLKAYLEKQVGHPLDF